MEKKTIGSFIAALRKANGLTQQELADRLNVSNKAVSRWERDECAPDILLLPAIAEILGVSCDELLKGERICPRETAFSDPETKSEPKVEKQTKALLFVVSVRRNNRQEYLFPGLRMLLLGIPVFMLSLVWYASTEIYAVLGAALLVVLVLRILQRRAERRDSDR